MALPIGKLTIIVGAGIVGSVLAKEGSIPTVSDIFSGAFKVFWKQIRNDDSKAAPSRPKPRNDSLMQQVNSLRQELQLLASNRSVTIVTSGGSGSTRYGIVIVVIVVGGGYIWWKGWKLPDMLFATRRSLSDASTAVTKQLENVYTSIAATKQFLSSRIDRVDCNLDECGELTAATREEVSELRGEVKVTSVDVQSVHHAVRSLETKIHRIEGKQDATNEGVKKLVYAAWNLENSRAQERIQAAPSSSSRPALEMPQRTPSSGSLQTESPSPIPSVELSSPAASNGTTKRRLQNAVSASGLKELNGISADGDALTSPGASTSTNTTGDTNNGNSGARMFGRTVSGISASFLSRTRSAMQSYK